MRKLFLFLFFSFVFHLSSPLKAQDNFSVIIQELLDSAFKQQEFERGQHFIDEAITIVRSEGDSLNLGLIYNWQGQYMFKHGKYLELQKSFETSLKIAEALKDSLQIAQALGNLSIAYQSSGDLERSVSLLEQAIEINILTRDSVRLSHAYSNLGNTLAGLNQLPKALRMTRKSLVIDSIMGNKSYTIGLVNIADIYATAQEYSLAIDYSLRALSENYDKRPNINFSANHTIGRAYSNLDVLDKALHHFQESRLAAQEYNGGQYFAAANEGLASVYEKTGDFQRAIILYREALQYGNVPTKVQLINNIGWNYLQHLQNLDSSRYYFNISYDLAREIRDTTSMLRGANGLLVINYQEGNISAARALLDSVLLYKESNIVERLNDDVLLHMAKVFNATGEHDKAVSYINTAYELVIKKRAADKSARNRLAANEASLLENEILKQKIILDKAEAETKESFRNQVFTIIVAALFAIFAFLQYRDKKREKGLKNDLSEKNGQLNTSNQLLKIARTDIFHRVRNDFQSVAAMIKLQAAQAITGEVVSLLDATADRVEAMGQIHNFLHQETLTEDNAEQRSIMKLINQLIQARTIDFGDRRVTISTAVDEGIESKLSFSHYSWLGMMINELLTNASKHGKSEGDNINILIKGFVESGSNHKTIEVSNLIAQSADELNFDTSSRIGLNMMERIAGQLGWAFSFREINDQAYGTISFQ